MQILDAPAPQMGPPIPAVLEQVLVQSLPEAHVVEHVARVRVPQMAFPSLDVPQTGLHDPTDTIVLELDEVEEEAEEEVEEDSTTTTLTNKSNTPDAGRNRRSCPRSRSAHVDPFPLTSFGSRCNAWPRLRLGARERG